MPLEKLNRHKIDDFSVLQSVNIQGVTPFKIIYDNKVVENFEFYVRGYKMKVKFNSELVKIVDRINSYEVINTNELIKDLQNNWPREACLYFLSMIYDKGGFKIVDLKQYT